MNDQIWGLPVELLSIWKFVLWKKNRFRIAALNDSLPVLPSLFTLGRKHILLANFRIFLLHPISGTKILHLHRFSLTGIHIAYRHWLCWYFGPESSLLWGVVLCTRGCLAVSLASTCQMPVGPPLQPPSCCDNQKRLQILLYVSWGQNHYTSLP